MAQSGTNLLGEGLHVDLDRASATPIHVQLEAALREAIRAGRLPGDSVVPPSRRLAHQFGISRGVVVEAYQQLTAEGYLVSSPGGYTRVATDIGAPRAVPTLDVPEPTPRSVIDFGYGRPDVSEFPRAAWLKTLRWVLANAPNSRLDYPGGRGVPELRAALAEYLNRVRGTWASPDTVTACNGFAQAVTLVFPVLVERGITRLAVEDPSDDHSRREALRAGMTVVPIPMTATGIDTDVLAASGAQAVLVTPAHQFPTGCVLSPERRSALVTWAKAVDGIIIEDDYDAEYRYDQTPVGSLQGLAPEHVIYAGTASKTLAPGLRLGWIVAPELLADAIAQRKLELDRGSPIIEQLAFAEFLTRGEFDRHLRRMRPLYRRRRDALLEAMAELVPQLEPVGVAAGLHVLCWLPDGLDEQKLIAAAEDAGLRLEGLRRYRLKTKRQAILIGYARLDEDGIREGVRRLRDAIAAVQSSAPSAGSEVSGSGALLPAS